MKRLIGLIQGILPFFAAMLVQYSLISILQFGIKITTGSDLWDISVYYVGAVAAFLCGLIFFFWYANTVHYYKLVLPRQVFQGKSILLLIGLGVATQFAISGMMSLLQPFLQQLFQNYKQVVDSILNHNINVVLLYVVIIAPITEELIFRGVMLAKLQTALPFYGANLIQAATFGIYHWNVIQGAYAFGIGILFGYVVRRFRSLTASVLLHMAVNGASFLVVWVPNTTASFTLSTVAGLLVMVVFLYLINRRMEVSSCNK